jgi:hypothetical protein
MARNRHFHFAVTRDHDDRQIAATTRNFALQRQSVHLRHPQIGNQTDCSEDVISQEFASRTIVLHGKLCGFEQHAKRTSRCFIVVHNADW